MTSEVLIDQDGKVVGKVEIFDRDQPPAGHSKFSVANFNNWQNFAVQMNPQKWVVPAEPRTSTDVLG